MITPSAWRVLLVFALVCSIAGQSSPSQAAQPLNILFIGNSHTYFNDLPIVFRNIVSSAGKATPNVSSSTFGGYTLSEHLKNIATLQAIDHGWRANHKQWDVVVLQEHSAFPALAEDDLRYRNEFQTASSDLYDRIKHHNPNARVVLFETPAWNMAYWTSTLGEETSMGRDARDMQRRACKWCMNTAHNYIPAHSTAPRKNDTLVAHIGDAWELNYRNRNSIMLHMSDYYHPNPAGTYLGGLVMYATIYNANPSGIRYRGKLNRTTADYLQTIAETNAHESRMPMPRSRNEARMQSVLAVGMGCLLVILYGWQRKARRRNG